LANGGEKLANKRFSFCEDCHLCDTILVEGQKNISEKPGPEHYMHKPTDFVLQGQSQPLTPEEQLKRSEKLREGFRFPSAELTVGDISIPAENKPKHRVKDAKRFLRNMEEGLSVGDLADKEDDERGLDQLFVGRPIIEPATTQSGQIDAERIRRHQEQVDEVLHIRNLLAGARDERLERYLEKYLSNKPKESLQPAGSGRTNEPKEKA
jgi:hypothetical protein